MSTPDAVPLRVVIADDEPLARERIRDLLREERGIDVVDECTDGPSAVDAIRRLTPDLVFLDVQMPGADGFEVIDRVGPENMPAVIFVTAYDRYALRAFDVHALDYLLKPFDRERFHQALRRAQTRRGGSGEEMGRRLLQLVHELRPSAPRADRLVVKTGGRIFFLRAEEIDWIQAEGNYVRLHQGSHSHLVRETMASIENRLDSQRFFRIHRSSIVNIERVRELQPWFNGEYRVLLHDGTKLTLSRGYRDRLQARLGESF